MKVPPESSAPQAPQREQEERLVRRGSRQRPKPGRHRGHRGQALGCPGARTAAAQAEALQPAGGVPPAPAAASLPHCRLGGGWPRPGPQPKGRGQTKGATEVAEGEAPAERALVTTNPDGRVPPACPSAPCPWPVTCQLSSYHSVFSACTHSSSSRMPFQSPVILPTFPPPD